MLLSAGGRLGSAALRAAVAECPDGRSAIDPKRIAQDACQQASTSFSYMAPQLGTALAGGNATLGQGGALGGLGHFVGRRSRQCLLDGLGSQISQRSDAPRAHVSATSRPRIRSISACRSLDAAIGLFKGFPLGLTNVGGVDAIVNADIHPDDQARRQRSN